MDIRKFDVADFEQNPGKYQLFRTARIAVDYDCWHVGDFVAIEYIYNAREDVIQDGRIIPVYRVTDANGLEQHLYANAFGNFVL